MKRKISVHKGPIATEKAGVRILLVDDEESWCAQAIFNAIPPDRKKAGREQPKLGPLKEHIERTLESDVPMSTKGGSFAAPLEISGNVIVCGVRAETAKVRFTGMAAETQLP